MLFQVVVLIVGVVAGLAARALLVQLILLKFRRDVQRLNTVSRRKVDQGGVLVIPECLREVDALRQRRGVRPGQPASPQRGVDPAGAAGASRRGPGRRA